MRQGDVIRVLAAFAVAGAGASVALVGAAVTGQLGDHTTIEQFAAPASAPAASNSSLGAGGANLSVEQIYRLDAPGVVRITAPTGKLQPPRSAQLLGSGFVIDKAGHIVTSNRVIAGAGPVKVSFTGNDELDARVVGKDPSTDVAVLQIDAHSRSLSPLPLGDSDSVQVGDAVVAIGNPFSLSRTATAGIVSGVQRTIDAPSSSSAIDHAIQTDAAINAGNAGGPLIDTRGEVIGVNLPTIAGGESRSSLGVGFAIPIDTVKTVAAQLITSGKVDHVYLGITALPVTPTLARICDLPASRGLIVQGVAGGSAAALAGVRAGTASVVVAGDSYRIGGDIIVAADGAPVATEAGLRNLLERLKPGDRLTLAVWRDGKRKTVQVTLGRPPG